MLGVAPQLHSRERRAGEQPLVLLGGVSLDAPVLLFLRDGARAGSGLPGRTRGSEQRSQVQRGWGSVFMKVVPCPGERNDGEGWPSGLSGLCPGSRALGSLPGAPVCPLAFPFCLVAGSSPRPSLSALPPALLPVPAPCAAQLVAVSAAFGSGSSRLTPAQTCAKFCKNPALGRGELTRGVGWGVPSTHAVPPPLVGRLFPGAHVSCWPSPWRPEQPPRTVMFTETESGRWAGGGRLWRLDSSVSVLSGALNDEGGVFCHIC